MTINTANAEELQRIVEQERRETVADVDLALKAMHSKATSMRRWPGRKHDGARIEPKKYFSRSLMPYGIWTCADGREVLFDRDYAPICERRPGSAPRMADPNEWVRFKKQEWFYTGLKRESARLAAAFAALDAWGVREMVLADIAGYLKRGVAAELAEREGRRHG